MVRIAEQLTADADNFRKVIWEFQISTVQCASKQSFT